MNTTNIEVQKVSITKEFSSKLSKILSSLDPNYFDLVSNYSQFAIDIIAEANRSIDSKSFPMLISRVLAIKSQAEKQKSIVQVKEAISNIYNLTINSLQSLEKIFKRKELVQKIGKTVKTSAIKSVGGVAYLLGATVENTLKFGTGFNPIVMFGIDQTKKMFKSAYRGASSVLSNIRESRESAKQEKLSRDAALKEVFDEDLSKVQSKSSSNTKAKKSTKKEYSQEKITDSKTTDSNLLEKTNSHLNSIRTDMSGARQTLEKILDAEDISAKANESMKKSEDDKKRAKRIKETKKNEEVFESLLRKDALFQKKDSSEKQKKGFVDGIKSLFSGNGIIGGFLAGLITVLVTTVLPIVATVATAAGTALAAAKICKDTWNFFSRWKEDDKLADQYSNQFGISKQNAKILTNPKLHGTLGKVLSNFPVVNKIPQVKSWANKAMGAQLAYEQGGMEHLLELMKSDPGNSILEGYGKVGDTKAVLAQIDKERKAAKTEAEQKEFASKYKDVLNAIAAYKTETKPNPIKDSSASRNVNTRNLAQYESHIEEASKETGIDKSILKALILQESGGKANAVGDGGKAVGLTQLHPDAARESGLSLEDRYDPKLSIMGGARYLKKKLMEWNGDIESALAAYNQGTGAMRGGNFLKTSRGQRYAEQVLSLERKISQTASDLEASQNTVAQLKDSKPKTSAGTSVNNISSSNNNSPKLTVMNYGQGNQQTASLLNAWSMGMYNPVGILR